MNTIPKEVFWPYFAGFVALLWGLFAFRKEVAQARCPDKLVALGPVFFAMPLAAFAAEHFMFADIMVPMIPAWFPGRLFWIYFTGTALVAAVVSIFLNRKVSWSGTLLGIMIFSFVVLLHIPKAVANPHDRFAWAIAARDLCFASAALLLATTHTAPWLSDGQHKLIAIAGYLIGIILVFFSIEHFLHPEFVPGVPLNKVTPTFLPFRSSWGYATGIALAVTGISIIARWRSRLIATGLGLGYLLIVIFIYLPMMLMSWFGAGSRIEGLNFFLDTLMFGGVILILAGAQPATGSRRFEVASDAGGEPARVF